MNDYRIIGVVTVENIDAVEAHLVAILGPQYADLLSARARRASPTGQEPATHIVATMQMPTEVALKIAALLDPANGIDGYRGKAAGVDGPSVPEVLDATKLPSGDPSEWRWDITAVLQKLSLKVIPAASTPPHM